MVPITRINSVEQQYTCVIISILTIEASHVHKISKLTRKGEQHVSEIYPVVYQATLAPGYKPGDLNAIAERSILVQPQAHPDLIATIEHAGANRLSEHTWVFGIEQRAEMQPLRVAARLLESHSIVPDSHMVTERGGTPVDFTNRRRQNVSPHQWPDWAMRAELPIDARNSIARWADNNADKLTGYRNYGQINYAQNTGKLVISSNGRSIYMTIRSTNIVDVLLDDEHAYDLPTHLKVPLNLRMAGRATREPKPVYPAAAFTTLEILQASGGQIIIDEDVAQIRREMTKKLVAYPAPGRPAEVMVTVGRRVKGRAKLADRIRTGSGNIPLTVFTRIQTIKELKPVIDKMRKTEAGDNQLFLHPQTQDLYAIAAAEPVKDEKLRDYQRLAVGMHLATNIGYVNALEPGMGKTICALGAMRLRAKQIPRYRGLVVAEANVRDQWAGEVAEWFPEAEIVPVYGKADTENLHEALTKDVPIVVITSYAVAGKLVNLADHGLLGPLPGSNQVTGGTDRAEDILAQTSANTQSPVLIVEDITIDEECGLQGLLFENDGEISIELIVHDAQDAEAASENEEEESEDTPSVALQLSNVYWHDLIGDEAAVLRNPSTRQSRALWILRERSQIAVALTGTPITTNGVDDLGRLLAWTRGDRNMFAGARLSKEFDLADDDDLARFQSAVGPLVFRRNKTDISDELPELSSRVVELTPTIEEMELSRAAREELKRVYLELVSLLELAKPEKDDPRYEQAKQALAEARGAWLGGTTLARMAASDPAALENSTSAGAALLRGANLIQAAVDNGGTKRTWAVKTCVDKVKQGQQVIVFTEFTTVGRKLIEALQNEGLRVGKIFGGGGRARDVDVRAFREQELDILVSTSAGKRGLNLQTAAMVIHYDLPWTPDDIVQRTARVERIGATADAIEVVFPILKGTIEERIAALVTARAATAMRALDVARGANATETDMARIVGGLFDIAQSEGLNKKQASLLDITRELLAS